jgi:hypothetical protein
LVKDESVVGAVGAFQSYVVPTGIIVEFGEILKLFPLQIVSATAVTTGVGFTVIAKLKGLPWHVPAFGVTE